MGVRAAAMTSSVRTLIFELRRFFDGIIPSCRKKRRDIWRQTFAGGHFTTSYYKKPFGSQRVEIEIDKGTV